MKSALGYALEGWRHTFRQPNFRRQLAIMLIAWFMGATFKLSSVEWGLLILTSGLVLTAEMINTAVESVVDLVTHQQRIEAKIAKDIAAGMVLLSAILSVIVGYLLFGTRILTLLN